ncbi:hypothetical protein NQ318_003130 [Aromia moschata]|uniref:DDE Tnp4 domain-containing protein n=1 Tax=Aromia moschata TaxID=1265417 RepID=A0AAV8YUK6_9CUCU|nr:hypothetical protein NQ318_003130 [Aromia moschata]
MPAGLKIKKVVIEPPLSLRFPWFPTTVSEWNDIANAFQDRWQFPHCLGAVDGKHVQIIAPHGSGSYYFNYNKTHSIVLMAIAKC